MLTQPTLFTVVKYFSIFFFVICGSLSFFPFYVIIKQHFDPVLGQICHPYLTLSQSKLIYQQANVSLRQAVPLPRQQLQLEATGCKYLVASLFEKQFLCGATCFKLVMCKPPLSKHFKLLSKLSLNSWCNRLQANTAREELMGKK